MEQWQKHLETDHLVSPLHLWIFFAKSVSWKDDVISIDPQGNSKVKRAVLVKSKL